MPLAQESERDSPDVEKREPPPFDGGSVWFRCSGTVPLEATNSAPAIDQRDLGRSPEGIAITGGCDFDFHRATLSGSFVLLGTIAPLRRPARHRVRMRSSRSSCAARVASPSASALAVPPGPDGFLRGRPFRIVRRAAGLLRPAAGHGVRQVSGSSDDSAQVVVAGSLPAGAHPSKRSPPRWSLDRHRRPCSRGMAFTDRASIHRRVRSALATFPSENSRCSPGLSGMRSGDATRVAAGSHRADLIPFTSKSTVRGRAPSVRARHRNRGPVLHLPCHQKDTDLASRARTGMLVVREQTSSSAAHEDRRAPRSPAEGIAVRDGK